MQGGAMQGGAMQGGVMQGGAMQGDTNGLDHHYYGWVDGCLDKDNIAYYITQSYFLLSRNVSDRFTSRSAWNMCKTEYMYP